MLAAPPVVTFLSIPDFVVVSAPVVMVKQPSLAGFSRVTLRLATVRVPVNVVEAPLNVSALA